MTNRHKKIVLEAEEGITFEVSETGEKLVIRARSIVMGNVCHELPTVSAGEYAEELSIYTDKDGNQAVILPGWTVSGNSSENTIWGKDVSLVIYRIPKEFGSIDYWEDRYKLKWLKKTYSQLVWVPVKFLQPNGTLDGENFVEKFGRRNYRNDKFSSEEYNEPLEGGLLKQKESVSKYGGFYISRYVISKSTGGKPQSVQGNMPWVNINFPDAQSVAATFECNDVAQSQVTCGAEEDSMLEWLIESGCKTLEEVAKDSVSWGKHWNTKGAPRRVVETGSREEWSGNNVYDVAGNTWEWTQEKKGISNRVLRGSNYDNTGNYCPAAFRHDDYPNHGYVNAGFRATVYIIK